MAVYYNSWVSIVYEVDCMGVDYCAVFQSLGSLLLRFTTMGCRYYRLVHLGIGTRLLVMMGLARYMAWLLWDCIRCVCCTVLFLLGTTWCAMI